jgi:hypothetical protein
MLLADGSAGVSVAAFVGAAALLFVGFVLSIVGLVQISRSAGRLYGTAWGVVGVILTPLTLLALGVLALAFVGEVEPPPEGDPFPNVRKADWGAWDELVRPGPVAPPAPRLEGPRSDASAAALKVVGGPVRWTDSDRVRATGEIEALWTRLVAVMEREPNPDVKALALAPAERERLRAMATEQRKRAQDWNRLGMPFLNRQVPPLSDYRLGWLVLEKGAERGRAVMAKSDSVLSFPVARVDGTWYATLGVVEVLWRALQPEDRSGWLDDAWYGADRDPAERVTGGPTTWTELDRQTEAAALTRAWRLVDESHGSPLSITWPQGTRHSDYKVFHAALDAVGTKGRLIVSAASWTIALPIERHESGDWTIIPDGEVKPGSAQPGDRDGTLDR